ncbi:MAG TPA: BamA/TamA family outer membrane protein, partial [Candidatus Krumholzibacterium sp.]|nr:BamA/TamA family outer membrane protein [Candidatus Krumholzibacterium sp.]
IADGVIESMLRVETGETLDIDELERQLIAIYGLELFESVYYDVEKEGGESVLSVTVRERSWGPNYIQAGFAVSDDFEAANFNVCLAYTRTAINSLGGEWRSGFQMGQEPGVFTDFYQPLDRGLRYFLRVKGSYIEQTDNLIDPSGHKFGELGIYRYGGMFEAGRELGCWGRISAGLKRESGKITVQVGDPESPERKFDNGEVFAQIHLDELDDIYFPGHGGALRIRASAGLEELGSDTPCEQAVAEGRVAVSAGSWSFNLGGAVASTLDSDAPYQNLFPLGGFMRISGLEQDEIRGQHAAMFTGTVFKRIHLSSMLSLNLGVTTEYGNVFQSRDEIGFDKGLVSGSLFLGADTIAGPIFIAWGLSEYERDNFYFCLGLPWMNTNALRLDH